MDKIWDWLVEKGLKNRKLVPILVAAAVIASGFVALKEIRNDPALTETLRSPAFLILCLLALPAALIVSSRRSNLPRQARLRLGLHLLLGVSAALGIGWIGLRLWQEQRPFQLQVILLGPQTVDYAALADILNRAPKRIFRLKIVDRRDWEDTSPDFFRRFVADESKWRRQDPVKPRFAATVVLVGVPVDGNLFGYGVPQKNIAVQTTAGWPDVASRPSVYEYVVNQVFAWALFCGGPADRALTDFHPVNEDELCLFDYSREKAAIDAQIRNPQLCRLHEQTLRAYYGPAVFEEFWTLVRMAWLRDAATREELQRLHNIRVSTLGTDPATIRREP